MARSASDPDRCDAYRVAWLEECLALSALCADLAEAGAQATGEGEAAPSRSDFDAGGSRRS